MSKIYKPKKIFIPLKYYDSVQELCWRAYLANLPYKTPRELSENQITSKFDEWFHKNVK